MVVAVFAAAALVLAALLWYAILVVPAKLQLTMLDVAIEGLPPDFDGYRIAILSDFHHGPQQPLARAARAVAFANAQAPHLVALLGDYGTSEWAAPKLSRRWYRRTFSSLGPVLQTLRARDGIVAVLGNHDHYASDSETQVWLESLGVRVLRNASIELPSSSGPLGLVGIDDLEEGELDVARVAPLLGGTAPVIVLSHHPDGVMHVAHPNVRLVVAGHTHGGQVVLPWIGAPVTRARVCTRRHPAGWVPNAYAPLFVSRGIGSQIPIRFGAPPEVVILTLRLPSAGLQAQAHAVATPRPA